MSNEYGMAAYYDDGTTALHSELQMYVFDQKISEGLNVGSGVVGPPVPERTIIVTSALPPMIFGRCSEDVWYVDQNLPTTRAGALVYSMPEIAYLGSNRWQVSLKHPFKLADGNNLLRNVEDAFISINFDVDHYIFVSSTGTTTTNSYGLHMQRPDGTGYSLVPEDKPLIIIKQVFLDVNIAANALPIPGGGIGTYGRKIPFTPRSGRNYACAIGNVLDPTTGMQGALGIFSGSIVFRAADGRFLINNFVDAGVVRKYTGTFPFSIVEEHFISSFNGLWQGGTDPAVPHTDFKPVLMIDTYWYDR